MKRWAQWRETGNGAAPGIGGREQKLISNRKYGTGSPGCRSNSIFIAFNRPGLRVPDLSQVHESVIELSERITVPSDVPTCTPTYPPLLLSFYFSPTLFLPPFSPPSLSQPRVAPFSRAHACTCTPTGGNDSSRDSHVTFAAIPPPV